MYTPDVYDVYSPPKMKSVDRLLVFSSLKFKAQSFVDNSFRSHRRQRNLAPFAEVSVTPKLSTKGSGSRLSMPLNSWRSVTMV